MNDVDAEQARRRSIIEDARATVERLQRQNASWDVRSQLPPIEDKLTRWRREAEAQERAFARERAADKQREQRLMDEKTQSDASWNAWADRKIAVALEAHGFNEIQTDAIGMTLAEERKAMREEIQAAIGELRAELAVQRAHESGTVIDLPALPRRRSDAA
jgi:TPP-dependent trihydroxycyclohexane-1,2-dione (THcHDO) dehydratase